MAKWLAKEFDWDTGRYTGNYYDIAEAGIVAVFVDSHFGNDSNAGTAVAPYKTLGAAITYLNANGANGSRIFMNGIFSETLPIQTYWYEFIGCGGGRNGRTLWVYNDSTLVGITFNGSTHFKFQKIHNVELLNYNERTFYSTGGAEDLSVYFVNCFLKNIKGQSAPNSWCVFYYGIIRNLKSTLVTFFNNRIEAHNSICLNIDHDGYGQGILSGVNNYVRNCNYSMNGLVFSLIDGYAGFVKESMDDYNVLLSSPLLGAGPIDEITGRAKNIGNVSVGLSYNGNSEKFNEITDAILTNLSVDSAGRYTITQPATTGTLETALMDLGNIYPLENIDLFNVFDFAAGEITQGVFEDFVSPRMALTIKLKYGLTEAEVTECPWLLIEYGKQPTFSGTGASRVGNADATFDPDTFQEITCRYMKLFVTLQNNS